jgi:hypothetical protein
MFISLCKKYGILSLLFINLAHAEMEMEIPEEYDVEMIQKEVQTTSAKPWYQRGMFWFGLLNGLQLPIPYAIAIGFNLVDISHPAVEEKLKPFAHGACAGIGLWLLITLLGAAASTNQPATVCTNCA